MFNGRENIKTGSQQLIKETNIKHVFLLISKYDGISRAELANITGLSPTTISSLAEELIAAEFIMEDGVGNIPTSGRKPIMLKVNPAGGCIVSVDLQNNGYNIGIFDLNCTSIIEKFISLINYENLGESLVEEIGHIVTCNGYAAEQLLGICIGAPGIIDRKAGRILSSTILPIDGSNNFYDLITDNYKEIKIEIMNESSLSAYTEMEFGGHTNGIRNLIYIDIHTGIGAGIIINGKMYEGSGALAGEFGHISVDLNGPVCKCGSRGCLEILASIPALIANIETETDFTEHHPGVESEAEKLLIIADEYKTKDKYLSEINKTAEHIAYGINNAINLIDPGAVIIGGEITVFGEKLLNKIISIQKKIGLDRNQDIKILLSEYNGNPVTAGGAKHIFNTIF